MYGYFTDLLDDVYVTKGQEVILVQIGDGYDTYAATNGVGLVLATISADRQTYLVSIHLPNWHAKNVMLAIESRKGKP